MHFQRAFLASISFLFIAFATTGVFAQDEDEVIAVDSSVVIMNAYVTDASGRFISSLRKEHFRVFEEGIERPIELFANEDTPFAAVVLLDTSGSMGTHISLARAAAIRFLEGLRDDDVAAIYRFDSRVVQVQDFSNSRDVPEKIFDLRSYGMTTLNDAVYQAAIALSERAEKRRAIIVLSDGADTQSGRSADAALKASLAANAVIYTVDMSSPLLSSKDRISAAGSLKRFAERSGGTFIATPGGAEMRQAFERIVTELGSQYTIGFSPLDIKKDGKWRSLELRISRPNLNIRTRKGYNAERVK